MQSRHVEAGRHDDAWVTPALHERREAAKQEQAVDKARE